VETNIYNGMQQNKDDDDDVQKTSTAGNHRTRTVRGGRTEAKFTVIVVNRDAARCRRSTRIAAPVGSVGPWLLVSSAPPFGTSILKPDLRS
jgi:hypothetical protein